MLFNLTPDGRLNRRENSPIGRWRYRSAEEVWLGATYSTKVALAFRSGGRCAYPKCAAELVHVADQGTDQQVAEAAHIAGEKPKAARYDPSMTEEQRNALENLIYMCPTHHRLIDKLVDDWPTERLLLLKSEHEQNISEATAAALADIAFEELAKSVAWVSKQDVMIGENSFVVLNPAAKIEKNGLSNGSKHIIAAGLAAQSTVAEFVTAETQLDPDFPHKLKAGFLAKYYTLIGEGHKGDMLFDLMCSFAQQGMKFQKERSAGLAVLVYLFERCDVFEK